MECYSGQQACVTLKDHNDNLRNNTYCRLISLSKSKVGCESKSYLNNIITDTSCKTEVNQWRNTATVINWFKSLLDNHKR